MKEQAHKKVGQYDRRVPYSRRDKSEARAGKKEFAVCPDCKNVYYKKSWHHDFPAGILPERQGVRFVICPACKMTKDELFEGQMVIENVSEDIREELLNLIKNFGEGARKADCQHRIAKISESGNKVEVFTTENQLAQRIARRVKDIFGKNLNSKISYSKGEDIVRVRLTFSS